MIFAHDAAQTLQMLLLETQKNTLDIASIVLFLVMNMRKKVSEQTHCVLSVQAVDFNHPPAPQIPIHPLVSSHSKFSKEPRERPL